MFRFPKDNTIYRAPEVNDCELISGTATGRQDFGDTRIPGIDGRGVKQDFTVKFRKPMETKGLKDFDLVPGKSYNVTAFLGCSRDDRDNRYGTDAEN